MFRLDGKVAVVIGGMGYLGKQFCRALLEYGASVYCCDVQANLSQEDERFFHGVRSNLHPVTLDAAKQADLHRLAKEIQDEHGRVDILVNTTTMKGNDFYLPFEEVSLEGWEMGLLGNLTIPFLAIQAFIPYMKGRGSGSIINIASHYGLVGNDQRIYEGSNLHELYVKESPQITRVYAHGVYNAAKGGLINFTRYLAAYYGEHNIRVNTISPGGIYYERENAEFLKRYSEKVPLGRKAKVDEVNGALVFLASDASSYVTGHNLVVDGGYTCW